MPIALTKFLSLFSITSNEIEGNARDKSLSTTLTVTVRRTPLTGFDTVTVAVPSDIPNISPLFTLTTRWGTALQVKLETFAFPS